MKLSPLLAQLRPVLAQHATPVYLVGGAVRDALLGRESHDLDFVVAEGGVQLAFKVGNALGLPAYVLDRERDTGRVVARESDTTLDFAVFRGPDLEADLRNRDFTINAMALPVGTTTDGRLLTAAVIDPCGGRADLQAGVIRQTNAAAVTSDPARALRAIRMALAFNFRLTAKTAQAVTEAAALLGRISPERVRDEFLKLVAMDAPHEAVRQMAELKVLAAVLPEVAALEGVAQSPPHHEAVLAHTITVLRWLVEVEAVVAGDGARDEGRKTKDQGPKTRDNSGIDGLSRIGEVLGAYRPHLAAHLARPVTGGLNGRMVLRLAALFHDVGKAVTQSVEPNGRIRFFDHDKVGAEMAVEALWRLRLSNEAIAHVRLIVGGHMRPLHLTQAAEVSRRAIYRFFRDTQTVGLDVGLLTLADHLATYGGPGRGDEGLAQWERLLGVVGRLYDHYFNHHAQTIQPAPILDGNALMAALKLKPGPQVGRLLRHIEEAQAAGEISTAGEAILLAQRMSDER